MPKVIFISGPCGCGKSTFADAYARHLVNRDRKTIYVIHGDDFHAGFVEVEDKGDFGDLDMIERAKFLKKELELMPENKGHLYDNTDRSVEEMVSDIRLEDYIV